MELVGHPFFLFVDSLSGLPSVVYRRHGYDYGVIRIDTAVADPAIPDRADQIDRQTLAASNGHG